MDEKQKLKDFVEPAAERRSGTWSSGSCRGACRRRMRSRLSYLVALGLVFLTVVAFVRRGPLLDASTLRPVASKVEELRHKLPLQDVKSEKTETAPVHATSKLVPLEAHIMSKCPDAQDCLRDLVLPTMQRVYDKVNFTLSYIGRPTGDGGVECMHGPAECMGNILELCAAKLYPDPKIYLGFTMCLTFDYSRIPDRDLVEDCALEHAVDVGLLNECATKDDGQYAMNLLRESTRHTADVGVTKSCTVRLDNQVYCIRDDGEWKDCPAGPGVHDLIITVEKLYRQN